MANPVPEIATERLVLGSPEAGDFPVYRDFHADADASAFYGGPQDAAQAWRRLAQDIGHWALRGHGMWSLVERCSGAMVGGCGLVWPEGWPRHELTWWIVPAARRQGYALEASRAAIRTAYRDWGWPRVETHMDDANEAARRLALRLGGTVIERIAFPDGKERDVFLLPEEGVAGAAR